MLQGVLLGKKMASVLKYRSHTHSLYSTYRTVPVWHLLNFISTIFSLINRQKTSVKSIYTDKRHTEAYTLQKIIKNHSKVSIVKSVVPKYKIAAREYHAV